MENMTACAPMTAARANNDVVLTYPAGTAYKQWVRKQLDERGWTFQVLVDEMKKRAKRELLEITDKRGRTMYETISTATISDFLGPEDEVPKPSNSKILPALNKTFGIPPPPICDPTDQHAQIVARFAERWAKMTPQLKAVIMAALGNNND